MNLLNVPEEILLIIIRQLDFKSVLSLYNTCSYTRKIVCMRGVIKKCQLSMSTIATVHSVKLSFFKVISEHLQELNMCGVHDLTKTSLLPAMKKLSNLKTINVSFTNISILDLIEIYQVCPTIKNVAITFQFFKPSVVRETSPEMYIQCKSLFKNFENVQFIGSCLTLLHSALAPYVLQDAKLDTLTYTIAEVSRFCMMAENSTPMPQFNQFSVYVLDWKDAVFYGSVTAFATLDLRNFEFVFIKAYPNQENSITYTVYASTIFKKFFSDVLGIDAICDIEAMKSFEGNFALMIWNKETTNFNDAFYSDLSMKVQQFFPCNYHSLMSSRRADVHKNNNWFYIVPTVDGVQGNNDLQTYAPTFKKKRVSPSNVVLNYDEMFMEKQKIQLSLVFNNRFINPIALPSNSNYLKKITFLSLSGSVRYSGDFFNILFRCCNQLITLNVEARPIFPCTSAISRSVPLSFTLRNLRIIDRTIDFKTLFSSLSQCKSLENVHIHDVSNLTGDIADPSAMFEKCENLYFFFIYASMTDCARIKKQQMLNKARARSGKRHLHIELFVNRSSKYYYYPFIDMFKLNPIKEPV